MSSLRFLQLHREDDHAVRAELAAGLAETPPRVSPKFLYDALGSRLFEAITELPEYYPTRTERLIFETHRQAIAEAVGRGRTLVDLGAGNGEKAAAWFEALAPRQYVAVDISVDHLRHALASLQQRHPGLPMLGLGVDFADSLHLPPEVGPGDRLLFYPGSSIGNFTPDQALRFLRDAHREAQGGGLLIGVDLVKDKALLDAAYDDPLQVTAAFNRNLLRRLSRLLGCDADVADFEHVAFYEPRQQRIEMHLQARRALELRWPGGHRVLAAGERIHTENSYKHTVEGFAGLLRDAGFGAVRHWTDPQHWFAVFSAAAAPA
ncbi:L-histidine N(alpha)-methyltransferase [Ideonella sp. A 288]|uniref:L-histidine N(alpha)-methyltransferase n=1 Tax=Ideonella sp. A 288 TaxID=1962181 RepID=UPI000B4B87CF|nr:L-histidine N(alpha)-methyltransferase [Ideonella sp. A 288]